MHGQTEIARVDFRHGAADDLEKPGAEIERQQESNSARLTLRKLNRARVLDETDFANDRLHARQRLGINLGPGTDGSVLGWGNLLGAIAGIAGFTCLRLWATAAQGKGSKQ